MLGEPRRLTGERDPQSRFAWLAPIVLWPYAQPLLPAPAVRPQGGGAQRLDEEAVFAAVLFVLTTQLPWRALPRVFEVSWQNSHRRFVQWTEAGLWGQLQDAVADGAPASVTAWAALVAERADARLREPHRSPTHGTAEPGNAEAGTADAGRAAGGRHKPVVRRIHRALAASLFGPRE